MAQHDRKSSGPVELFAACKGLPFEYAPDKSTFRDRFNCFSNGLFKDVPLLSFGFVVAGGSVVYCLLHDPAKPADTRSSAFRDTTIDLFPIATDYETAGRDIGRFVHFIAKRLPDAEVDVTLNTITLRALGYPVVNIALRSSPSKQALVDSFDVDPCCIGFDGAGVFGNDRAFTALRTRCFDTRPEFYSPTYVARLLLYAARGFAVLLPADIDLPELVVLPHKPHGELIRVARLIRDRSGICCDINSAAGLHLLRLLDHALVHRPDTVPVRRFYTWLAHCGVKLAATPEFTSKLVFAGKLAAFARYIAVSPLLVKPLRFVREPMAPAAWFGSTGPSKTFLGRLMIECMETAKRFDRVHDC